MTVFENENGFTIKAEANRPASATGGGDAPEIPPEVPQDYRSTLAFLIKDARSGTAPPTTLNVARTLLDKVLTDFRKTHCAAITPFIRHTGWFESRPDWVGTPLPERVAAFRKAGFLTEKFVQLAAVCDTYGGPSTSGPEQAKRFVAFVQQLIYLLYVTPARADSNDPR